MFLLEELELEDREQERENREQEPEDREQEREDRVQERERQVVLEQEEAISFLCLSLLKMVVKVSTNSCFETDILTFFNNSLFIELKFLL